MSTPFASPEYLTEDSNKFQARLGENVVSSAFVHDGKIRMVAPVSRLNDGKPAFFDSVKDWLVYVEQNLNLVGKQDNVIFIGFKGTSLDLTSEVVQVPEPICFTDSHLAANLAWPAPENRKIPPQILAQMREQGFVA